MIYKYRLRCLTDGVDEFVYGETEPTTCPTNTAHTIDSDSITVVRVIDDNIVTIREEDTPTGGHFQNETIAITAAGSSTFTYQHSWPFPVSVLGIKMFPSVDVVGNVVSTYSEALVGTASAALTGATDITVSQTVVDNAAIGFNLTIDNQDCGRILAISGSVVTMETALTSDIADGVFVVMRVYRVKNNRITSTSRKDVGSTKIGGTYVPANTVVNIEYVNNSLSETTIYPVVEYLY